MRRTHRARRAAEPGSARDAAGKESPPQCTAKTAKGQERRTGASCPLFFHFCGPSAHISAALASGVKLPSGFGRKT